MKLYTILRNLIQSIKNALQKSKDYTDAVADTKLTNELLLSYMEASATVGGNATTWVTLTCPSNRKILAPCGFYWFGITM